MQTRILTLVAVLITPSVNGAESYENLPPGTTRNEVLRIAGPPSSHNSGPELYPCSQKMGEGFEAERDRYDLSEGYVELAYREGVLIVCEN